MKALALIVLAAAAAFLGAYALGEAGERSDAAAVDAGHARAP